jgi:hypothetical protein
MQSLVEGDIDTIFSLRKHCKLGVSLGGMCTFP